MNLQDLKSWVEFSITMLSQFDVERRNLDTRIKICCAQKPGLLLSTVSTLKALGLEVQQCVISCFNEFSVQASCSDVGILIFISQLYLTLTYYESSNLYFQMYVLLMVSDIRAANSAKC